MHMNNVSPADICVLIPAYNEEKAIAGVVERARKFARKVVVVDDGSSDRTAEMAEKAGAEVIRHGTNQGKGVALRNGCRHIFAQGWDRLIVVDGDGQHPPEKIGDFVRVADETGAAIVVGNRMTDIATMPAVRFYTNWLTSAVISLLIGQKVPDSQCGFRLIRREALEAIDLATANYDTESEMLIEAGKKGFAIASVPIPTIYTGQVSKIRPGKDTWRFVRLVLRSLFAPGKGAKRKEDGQRLPSQ